LIQACQASVMGHFFNENTKDP
jgi:hypothetical protein